MDKLIYCNICSKKTIFTLSGSRKKGSCSGCGYSFFIDKDKTIYMDM